MMQPSDDDATPLEPWELHPDSELPINDLEPLKFKINRQADLIEFERQAKREQIKQGRFNLKHPFDQSDNAPDDPEQAGYFDITD